jgi:hypothetical protein
VGYQHRSFMAQIGVVVLDDMLPHNALEAARDARPRPDVLDFGRSSLSLSVSPWPQPTCESCSC